MSEATPEKSDPSSGVLSWIPVFFLASISILIAAILLSPMHWGVMDDVALLRDFETSFNDWTFWQYLRNFLSGEFIWGLYRPAYAAWNFFLYGQLAVDWGFPPSVAYALTAMIVYASLAFIGREFSRSFPEKDRSMALASYLVAVLAFTPSLNLVGLLSLQEKFPIVGAALAFALLGKNKRVEDVLGLLLFWVGPLAKSTGIVYGIPILFLLWNRRDGRKTWNQTLAAVFAASLGAWALYAKWVASNGHYTRRYQWESGVFQRYFEIGGFWGWTVAFFVLLAVAFGLKKKEGYRIPPFAWPLALAAWIVLMLPWGILGYYWSAVTPLWAACFAIVAVSISRSSGFLKTPRMLRAFIGIMLVLAISAHFFYKTHRLISRSVATGEIETWLTTPEARSAPETWVAYPCSEAMKSLALASRREAELRMWRPGEVLTEGALYLTWWECPKLPEAMRGHFALFRDWGAWKAFRYER